MSHLFHAVTDQALYVAGLVWTSFVQVASYVIQPSERLYWLYILTSLAFALGAYLLSAWRSDKDAEGGVFAFLFPLDILRNPSTWVDVRYFIPHQMVRVWIYGVFMMLVLASTSAGVQALLGAVWGDVAPRQEVSWYVVVLYTIIVACMTDFVSYGLHYLQHRFELLWAFHRVHHSSTVLNPLSNYREHPVDNILYALGHGLTAGGLAGFVEGVFGWEAEVWAVLGIGVPFLLFNLMGYHLRHSHIWVRWPGVLGVVFGSPAHHQIHHSCVAEHSHKNMAFMFPIWDVLFGTFCLPREKPSMEMGIGDGTENQYKGFVSIYLLPFKGLLGSKSDDDTKKAVQ